MRLSKYHIPFLYHGDTLEETTKGFGKPEDYTWEQLKKIAYRHPTRTQLLNLEEVFKMVGTQKYLFLDIKTDKIFDRQFAKKIATLVHQYHLQETVIVESFNPFFLIDMRLSARDIKIMYDFITNITAWGKEAQAQFDKIPWLLKQAFFQKQMRRIIRPDILGPRFNVDRKLLQSLINHGYPIVTWTVDTPEVAHNLFNIGIKGLQTNPSY